MNNGGQSFLHQHAGRLAAIVLVVCLYGLALQPELSEGERASLAAGFHFTTQPLPTLPGYAPKYVRAVNPSLSHISGWISTVGAAVALGDLDGDGLPNDLCYVDPRIDQAILAPVPPSLKEGPARYQPLALRPSPLPYEPNTMAPMGCLPGDVNEDGHMDLIVYYWGRTPILFLRQDHSYIPHELVPEGGRWYTNAATFADLDGDGHADLILGNYFQDGARILDAEGTDLEAMQDSMSRAYNGGVNRLFLWDGAGGGPAPTVWFKEIAGVFDEQIDRSWTLAIAAADLDGDLLPELYFANDFGPDRLLHNRSTPGELHFALLNGTKTPSVPNSKVLGRDSFKGMGVDFGDINADGLLDIYVGNIADEYALQESHFVFVSTGELHRMREGIAPYIDRSEPLGLSRSGWSWEVRLADFNNDGVLEALQATGFLKGAVNRWPELHETAMGNDELLRDPRSWHRFQPGDDLSGYQHNRFFVRAHDDRYYDLARELGLDSPHVTRGIATADVDGDGDLDFAVANQWEPSYFYRNESPHPGAFLGLHLRLPLHAHGPTRTSARPGHPGVDLPGRPAIGAAATVHLPDGRRLVAQVDGGNGHSGVRSPDLHFGLGRVPRETRLAVDLAWRDPVGHVHRETLHLTPGWHTVLLGGTERMAQRS